MAHKALRKFEAEYILFYSYFSEKIRLGKADDSHEMSSLISALRVKESISEPPRS